MIPLTGNITHINVKEHLVTTLPGRHSKHATNSPDSQILYN